MYDILSIAAYPNRLKEPLVNGENCFSRPDNRCLMGDITDLHFGSKAKAKKKKKLRQENVFVVWVLNISLRMPCSPLLADKPHGRINVMKTILYQKKVLLP